jgi:hypothetical protein
MLRSADHERSRAHPTDPKDPAMQSLTRWLDVRGPAPRPSELELPP